MTVARLINLEPLATYEDLGIIQAQVVRAGLLVSPSFSIKRRFPGMALEAGVAGLLDVFVIALRERVASAPRLELVELVQGATGGPEERA